jgi:hypothetical protein
LESQLFTCFYTFFLPFLLFWYFFLFHFNAQILNLWLLHRKILFLWLYLLHLLLFCCNAHLFPTRTTRKKTHNLTPRGIFVIIRFLIRFLVLNLRIEEILINNRILNLANNWMFAKLTFFRRLKLSFDIFLWNSGIRLFLKFFTSPNDLVYFKVL